MNVGGPAILISELLKGMNNDQFESRLVTGFCETNEIDFLEANSLKFNEIRVMGFGRSISPISDLRAFLILIRELKKLKPDIVHTHTAKAGFVGRLVCLLFLPKAKVIHTFHGHLLNGYFSKWKTVLVVMIERLFALFTDFIFAVGNQVKDDLLKAGIGNAEKIIVTYPGIAVSTDHDKTYIRKELEISDSEIVIIFVGRLTKIKRPDRLIDAFREVSKVVPNITLLVVGDGELRESASKLSSGLKIKFLGWRTDVNNLVAASDIAVLTSDNEGMPITLIESSYLGVPCISTNVGSVKDVIIDAKTGYLTSLDQKAIAERIEQLAISPSLRKKFGEAASAHARENFSVEAMIKTHADVYRKVIG
jgi:glycosyltransferase involved in cell wall biosynthesis